MMKKAVLTAIIMLSGVSAMAQYYPGPVPPPPPPGPVYYPGNGGYHGGGRSNQDDAMSAVSAASAAMFASLATICSTGPGCYYKQLINSAKDDAAMFLADGTKGANLTKALEELRKAVPTDKSSDAQLAEAILNFKE